MKKLFAIMALTLLAFSFLAVAHETDTPHEETEGLQEDSAEAEVEAQADAALPTTDIDKPKLHTIFIAAAQGIGVDAGDSSNFVVMRVTVGRVVLTKKFVQANASENADDEVRCNPAGKCWTVRKAGLLVVSGKESSARYLLRNVVVGEGTVSAELFSNGSLAGSISLSLVKMAGGQEVWAGKASIASKEWNVYIPFKTHRALIKPAMVRKAMEIGNKCGLTRPLEAHQIRECVQAGGKAAVKIVDGCPHTECVKPEKPLNDLLASIKARCEAKGGTLVRKPITKGRMHAGFRVACVVEGEVVEETSESTEGTASASPSTSPAASATEATATPAPSPSVSAQASVQAQASVSASVAAGAN